MNKQHKRLAKLIVFCTLLIGFVDVTTNMAATGIITAALSIPHINPPPKDLAKNRTPVEPTAFFVQVSWKDGLPHDLDIYVECSTFVDSIKHTSSVNYTQTKSGGLNLARDDLGKPSVLNVERVKSTPELGKVPATSGCIVNAHLYHSHGGTLPLLGTLTAISGKDGPDEKMLASVSFELRLPGDEVTVLSVAWDENGEVKSDSIETFPLVATRNIATVSASEGGGF